ncbi:hypothetical protein GO308_15805 [Sphingomonas sp. SFZ2018-12]|uniref:TauD/TfdA family dioxygenase n=1 Tax=Sphingomonas sp. SFZ2018-12 TaxID=2683197 RepID=UPI001F0EC55B|nr:hypothetical protein [Sphingomonas sp. SFZ2018-12]
MAKLSPPGKGKPWALIERSDEGSILEVLPEMVRSAYRAHGAILLRGFAADLDAFRRFTGQFIATSVFNESPDRRLLEPGENIQTVNGGQAPFPLHPELAREPWKPDVCFFHCLTPPRAQGQTTICDGTAIVDALPASLVAELARRRLLYIRPATPETLGFWLGTEDPRDDQLRSPPPHVPYQFRRTPQGILRIFVRPVLHVPMFTPALAFGNFLLFAHDYLGLDRYPVLDDGSTFPAPWLDQIRVVGQRLSVALAWQAGDLLMIDNTRFMHGRTAIVDPDDRLIATCFGYLDFAETSGWERDHAPWRRANFRPPQPRHARSEG